MPLGEPPWTSGRSRCRLQASAARPGRMRFPPRSPRMSISHAVPDRSVAADPMRDDELANDTLIRALLRQPGPYTPVSLMRPGGRHLPEYRETRRRAGSFLDLAQSPDLATEVTLQP